MDPGAGLAQAVEVEFDAVAEPHDVGGVVGKRVAGLGVQQNCQVASVEREPGDEACKEVGFEGDLVAPARVRSDGLVVPATENGFELRVDSGAQGFSVGLGLRRHNRHGRGSRRFRRERSIMREKLVPCGRGSTMMRAKSAKFSRTAVDGPRTGLVYSRRLPRVAFGPGVFRSVNRCLGEINHHVQRARGGVPETRSSGMQAPTGDAPVTVSGPEPAILDAHPRDRDQLLEHFNWVRGETERLAAPLVAGRSGRPVHAGCQPDQVASRAYDMVFRNHGSVAVPG